MLRRLVALSIIGALALPYSAFASFETKLNKGITGVESTLANLSSFDGDADRIFSKFSQSQRDEIAERVSYVVSQGKMHKEALKNFQQQRDILVNTGTGALSGGRHFRQLDKTIEAFEDYRALFSPSVGKAFVETPEPRYLRIQRQLKETPWYSYGEIGRLRRELESAFMEYSEDFVEKTLKTNRSRWDGFFHSLKNLQYSTSGFDLGLQYRLDRSFYSVQAMCAEKQSPEYGVPEIDEFPVEAPLASVMVFKPTSYGRRYSNSFDAEKADKLLPSSFSEMKQLPPEALSRAARRIKELQELVSKYERAAQRGDNTALDESWNAYKQLRERWDKAE
jgi:hypothetical protein